MFWPRAIRSTAGNTASRCCFLCTGYMQFCTGLVELICTGHVCLCNGHVDLSILYWFCCTFLLFITATITSLFAQIIAPTIIIGSSATSSSTAFAAPTLGSI